MSPGWLRWMIRAMHHSIGICRAFVSRSLFSDTTEQYIYLQVPGLYVTTPCTGILKGKNISGTWNNFHSFSLIVFSWGSNKVTPPMPVVPVAWPLRGSAFDDWYDITVRSTFLHRHFFHHGDSWIIQCSDYSCSERVERSSIRKPCRQRAAGISDEYYTVQYIVCLVEQRMTDTWTLSPHFQEPIDLKSISGLSNARVQVSFSWTLRVPVYQ